MYNKVVSTIYLTYDKQEMLLEPNHKRSHSQISLKSIANLYFKICKYSYIKITRVLSVSLKNL